MRRLIIFLATCGTAACSASTGSHPNERAQVQPATGDSVPQRHADLGLSGAWATGSTGEPAVPRIVIRPPCNFSPALWLLQQNGDTVRAWAIPGSHAQGVRASHPLSTVAAAEGRLSGVDLTMSVVRSTLLPQSDSPTTPTERYILRYDSTTGHLRGTLNGATFWAVRQDVVRPEGCEPIP